MLKLAQTRQLLINYEKCHAHTPTLPGTNTYTHTFHELWLVYGARKNIKVAKDGWAKNGNKGKDSTAKYPCISTCINNEILNAYKSN